MNRLSIVIVSWNTRELLKKCLEAIFNYAKNIDYQLIVIDNNSTDGSQEFLKSLINKDNPPSSRLGGISADARFCSFAQFPPIGGNLRFIQNRQNLGFAKAVNQGLKKSRGEYILLLNPDTQIKEETLKKSIEFLDQHQPCGVMGGKILNIDGSIQPSVRKFPTFGSQLFILLKFHQFFRPQTVKNYFSLNFDYSKTQEVDQVMGAFFLIRKKILEIVGYFDEKFFLWFEEVDFCRRVKNANWLIFYYPEAEIIHISGASFSQKISFKNQWQFNKSLLYYFRKHDGYLAYAIFVFLVPLSLFLSFLTSFFPFLRKFKKI